MPVTGTAPGRGPVLCEAKYEGITRTSQGRTTAKNLKQNERASVIG